MFVEVEAVQTEFVSLAAQACQELFSAYGVTLERTSERDTDEPGFLLAMITFLGANVRGTCSLAVTEAPLAQSVPVGHDLGDWIGELSNQLVGRMKIKLARLDVDIAMATPAVLRRAQLQFPLAGTQPFGAMFRSPPGGNAVVWLEVVVAPDFAFGVAEEEPCSEGDVLLF